MTKEQQRLDDAREQDEVTMAPDLEQVTRRAGRVQ
jgi:hypothetical protein